MSTGATERVDRRHEIDSETEFTQSTTQWIHHNWRAFAWLPAPDETWTRHDVDADPPARLLWKLRDENVIRRLEQRTHHGTDRIGVYQTTEEGYDALETARDRVAATDSAFPCGCGQAIDNRDGERGARCGHCGQRFVERAGAFVRIDRSTTSDGDHQ